jgi:hypothetical protein
MKRPYVVALILLTILSLLSLVFNGLVIFGLVRARQIALEAQQTALNTVTDARSIITGVGDDTFSYTFEVRQEIPINASVPFNDEITIPIRTTIPVSTVVIIPVDAGLLGTFDLDVPIRSMFPVDLSITFPVSQTVDVVTTVPLDVAVPIEVPLAETPLVGYIEELDTGLARLEKAIVQMERWLRNPLYSGED